MQRPVTLLSAMIVAASLLGAPSVYAAHGDGASVARTDAGDVRISRDQAATIARGSAGGRVLSIALQGGSRPIYRVKVLSGSGRVRTVTVDARTGAVR